MKTHKVIYYHACLFDAYKKTASECQQINHLYIYMYYVQNTWFFMGFVNLAVSMIHKIVDICHIS